MDYTDFIQYDALNIGSLRKWKNALYAIFTGAFIISILRHVLRRNKCSRMFPTRYMRWTNIAGSLGDILSTTRFKKLSLNVYLLQIVMGYQMLFKRQKFFYFWLSYSPVIVLTKAEAVEELISGSKHLEKLWTYSWLHPWLGTGLLTSHGSKWKTRRKLLTPSFHFEILKDFLPVFDEQSQVLVQLLEKEIEKPWTDIVQMVTLCSLDIVCETTLGVSIGAQKNSHSEYVQAVLRASDMFMKRVTSPLSFFDLYFWLTSVGMQFKKDVKLLHKFTRAVIFDKKQKRLKADLISTKKKRKALMDLLLEQHMEHETMSEEDIREEIDTFLFEGHDTTSMGMSWALYLLGLNKDVQVKVQEELDNIFHCDTERPITTEDLGNMEYLDRVLKESQRLYPSVPFFGRQLKEDAPLDGYSIPKGTGVIFFTYGLHRDETVFPNPEKFDPDRFLPEVSAKRHPYAYVPFSAGSRNCIGQRFAVMEEKVVLANILRNFSLESLDTRDKVLPAPELILRAASPIRIKIRPRTYY